LCLSSGTARFNEALDIGKHVSSPSRKLALNEEAKTEITELLSTAAFLLADGPLDLLRYLSIRVATVIFDEFNASLTGIAIG